jgi:hypothetical protein
MIGLHHRVKCKCCRGLVSLLYYDSTRSGFICHVCHREMMAYRLRVVNQLKHLGSNRWVCGQCEKPVSGLYYDRRKSHFICSDCEVDTRNRLSIAA